MMRNPTPAESKAAIRALKMDMLRKIIASIQWLIDHPEAQTRRELARDEGGCNVFPDSPSACKWCALGRVARDLGVKPDQTHDETRDIASIYTNLQRDIMKPLGLHTYTFVSANDRYDDPDLRQEKLKELMWTLGNKLDLMEKAA